MKAYQIFNETENALATPLHFLNRADAIKYQEVVRWPWMTDGYYVSSTGRRMPLEALRLTVQPINLHAIYSPELHSLFWLDRGEIGKAAVIPGYCFDLNEWKPLNEDELKEVETAARVREIEEKLRLLTDPPG